MRVYECFKLLKPGMFVRIGGDGSITFPSPFTGEIEKITDNEFFVLNNTKEYKYSWAIGYKSTENIQILDELPEDAKWKEEKTSVAELLQNCKDCEISSGCENRQKYKQENIHALFDIVKNEKEEHGDLFELEEDEKKFDIIINNLHRLFDK